MKNIAMFFFAATAILLVINSRIDAERMKRYYGGRDAQRGEHDWAVSIGFVGNRGDHFCGGSIIDARYVLSAAHCFELMVPSELVVYSGDIHRKNAIRTGVSGIIRHPDYKKTIGDTISTNDIAILKLDQNLVFRTGMSAIQLPTNEPQQVYASFAAWGTPQPKPVLPSRILQITTMKIISDSACTYLGLRGRRPYYICAYDRNGLMTQGDSGSGLTYNGEIIGVAAASENEVGTPCFFTNVYHYVHWIKETTGIENNV